MTPHPCHSTIGMVLHASRWLQDTACHAAVNTAMRNTHTKVAVQCSEKPGLGPTCTTSMPCAGCMLCSSVVQGLVKYI
jgi:hypothetical protein